MEEENRSFSWSGLFIKMILVVVFVIFTVWLLSLSTKDVSDSLDVITDNIFAENLEKMKKVGKEYFTKDKLPLKNGDIEILTLEEMYNKELILEIKDKNGNACSKENSYVSVEKFENEYQMKVYLECDEEKDHIIVIITCDEMDTCTVVEEDNKTTTNNKPNNKPDNQPDNKKTEYEYVLQTGGSWSNWGEWSDWSKVEISKLDNRDVETKVEKEEYSYTEDVTKIEYKDFNKKCPSGYILTQDGTQCYKLVINTTNPECSNKTNLVGRDGFNCKYTESLVAPKICPLGYELIGNNCKKTVSTLDKETTNPICPQLEGYLTTSRDGFTCTYTKHTYDESNPIHIFTSETVPANDEKYVYKSVGQTSILDKNNILKPVHIINQYEAIVLTETGNATCPENYKAVGNTCERSWLTTNTLEADLYCEEKNGYTLKANSNNCSYEKQVVKTATCPTEYSRIGNVCIKITNEYESYNNVCPEGYELTKDGNKCEKEVTTTVTKTNTKEVTYYRYRLREYVNGATTYKWSSSKEDKELLNAGYKLTGRTR